jgi:heterodisulfide reductase subunit A-like polyferredoxin
MFGYVTLNADNLKRCFFMDPCHHHRKEIMASETTSKPSQHVLIIGAGVGGASLAARLSHRGYKVTVVEKVSSSEI